MVERIQSSGVSAERLRQIALRKLNVLGVPTRPSEDGGTLEGAVQFTSGAVVGPNGEAVPRARFVVLGHDQLEFRDPPLKALGPVSFIDLGTNAALEEKIAKTLKARLDSLRPVSAKLTGWNLAHTLDPERLRLSATVRTFEHSFELSCGPDGIRVVKLGTSRGTPAPVSEDAPLFRLEDYAAGVDLELALESHVEQLKKPAAAPKTEATLRAVPAPKEALLLARVAQVFGEAQVGTGPKLELVQDFDWGGKRCRFVATHESGETFRCKVLDENGEKWSEKIALDRFPGTLKLVALVLGAKVEEPGQKEITANGLEPIHMVPRVGEVWLMNVLIETDDGNEVRYAGVNANGEPVGAARILSKRDFESVFTRDPARGGWRLLVVIDQVDGERVSYRHLDAQRLPRGAQRGCALSALISNFVPEAGAY